MFPIIVLYIALVLLRPQEYPALEDAHLPLLPVTLVLALGSWLLSGSKSFAAPQYALLGSFLAVMMLSEAANGWFGGVLAQLLGFGPALAAFVILANAITSTRQVLLVMAIFVLCATVLALHGIEQAKTGIGWTGVPLIQDGRIQYVGIFNDPNDLGMLFVLSLPMAVYLSGRGGAFGLRRLFWLGAGAMLLYGIYLTDSRGALLAVAAVLGLWMWRRHGIVAAALLGGIGLAGLLLLPSRLNDLSPDEESASGRVDAWYEGFQMFFSHPVFGVGADNFTDYNHLTAHNSLVLVLAETGFVGFTLWLGFVGYCFLMMLTVLRHQPELPDASATATWNTERAIAMTLLLSLSGWLATAFFLSRSYTVVLYLLTALVVAAYANTRRQFSSLPGFDLGRDWVRLAGIAAMTVVGLYVVVRVLLAFQ
ncbi:O-antigen ligase family protein [Frateuria terrea]|uniref:O-antigen ligase like membrane protein n=1 Tax=Frateuria terrea TaxID=529704 RepID=A0A1H6VS17_9GAMM|nr:O-antigen ligase family protein [Frateuria terrea]SEJ02815.1 O-antigen ligase like membrane protein [Frateuria terrea]SFP64257.1 O-antigen ligase like membrane protein [Frateuria terrea]